MKVQCNCSINEEIKDLAKEKHINLSYVLEEALRVRLRSNLNEIESKRVCGICGLNKPNMIYDGYMERWLCEFCNNQEVRKVSILARS